MGRQKVSTWSPEKIKLKPTNEPLSQPLNSAHEFQGGTVRTWPGQCCFLLQQNQGERALALGLPSLCSHPVLLGHTRDAVRTLSRWLKIVSLNSVVTMVLNLKSLCTGFFTCQEKSFIRKKSRNYILSFFWVFFLQRCQILLTKCFPFYLWWVFLFPFF